MKKSTAILSRLYIVALLMGGVCLCSSQSVAIQGEGGTKSALLSSTDKKQRRRSVTRTRKKKKDKQPAKTRYRRWLNGAWRKKRAYLVGIIGTSGVVAAISIWGVWKLYSSPSDGQPEKPRALSPKFYIEKPVRKDTYNVEGKKYPYHIFDVAGDGNCWVYVTIASLVNTISMNQQSLLKFSNTMDKLLRVDLGIFEKRVKAYKEKLHLTQKKVMLEKSKEQKECIQYFLQALEYHIFRYRMRSKGKDMVKKKATKLDEATKKHEEAMLSLLPKEAETLKNQSPCGVHGYDLIELFRELPFDNAKETIAQLKAFEKQLKQDPPDLTCITKVITSRLNVCELYEKAFDELRYIQKEVLNCFTKLQEEEQFLDKLAWLNVNPEKLATLVRFVRVVAAMGPLQHIEYLQDYDPYDSYKKRVANQDYICKALSRNAHLSPEFFTISYLGKAGYRINVESYFLFEHKTISPLTRPEADGKMPIICMDTNYKNHFHFAVPEDRI